MKKFFGFLGIVILLFLAFILISGIFISRSYHFERSITINATQEEVWKEISLFSNFEKWDPWGAKDPAMKRTISGTDGTVGAVYSWAGNDKTGSGSQTYTALVPYEHIAIAVQFKKPFESRALVFFHLTPEGKSVKMTWGFDNSFSYPMNAVAYYFMDMDDMLDKDFSAGLANLKKLCENSDSRMAIVMPSE